MIEMYMLEQLAAFSRHGTLSAASEELHLSQPSLSRSMRKLEELIGVPLFDRQRNRLSLNENGAMAAEYAERILEQESDMIEHLRLLERSRRTFSIGSPAPGPLMDFLPTLPNLYPDLILSSDMKKEEALLEGLRDKTYRMIFLTHPTEDPALKCRVCLKERLCVFLPARHPLADRPALSFRDLDGETILIMSKIGIWHDLLQAQLASSHFILQHSRRDLNALMQASSLPSFSTDLIIRLDPDRLQPGRKAIPIQDEDAVITFYSANRKEDEDLLRPFFHWLATRA